MLDLYWRYVTQGVVDITPLIRHQATDLEGEATRVEDGLRVMEGLTGDDTTWTETVTAPRWLTPEDLDAIKARWHEPLNAGEA